MKIKHTKYFALYAKIIVVFIIAIVLITLVVFFRTKGFNIPFSKQFISNPLYYYTEHLSLKFYLIYYFVFVFFINAILFLIYSFLYHKIKIIQENDYRIKTDHYATLIVENMYRGCVKTIVGLEEFLGKEGFEKLKSELKSIRSKKIFIDVLMKVHENVDGDLQRKLNKIFVDMELEEIAAQYLYSPDFDDRVFAMRVLSTFNIDRYNSIMLKYTKSKNEILRTEAYVALIKVDSDPLEFLMLYPFNLSEWDKVLILNTILQNRKTEFQIEDLIFAENTQVSSFAIFIAAKLKRVDLREMIVKKMNHPNINVRLNVITAVEEMPRVEDFEKLFSNFFVEDFSVKKQIIIASKKCPDLNMTMAFLNKILQSEEETLKTLARNVLNTFVKETVNKSFE